MPVIEQLDDIWAGAFEETDGILYRRLFQPTRPLVLEHAKTLREAGVVRDRELLGRWCLSIPLEDMEMLKRSTRWRELGSLDNTTRQKAWRRFMQHPDSAPYRVRERAS